VVDPEVIWPLCLLPILLLATPLLAQGENEGEDDGWTVRWANGTKIDSPDGDFRITIGGRLHADTSFFSADAPLIDATGELADGSELRRARLFVSGRLYQVVELSAEYDFAGGEVEPRNVYIGLRDTAAGNIRLGHFKEPFMLEELTSDNYISFIERSLNTIFAPSYNFGLMLRDQIGERLTWAAGAFRDTDGAGNAAGDTLGLTARITGLPLLVDQGRRLLHLGISASSRDTGTTPLSFDARPEAHLAPVFADTGGLVVEGLDLLDLELALVQGPLWATAEWTSAEARDAASSQGGLSPDLSFSGGNVQVGYFLTGERRPYRTSSGVFGRVRPQSVFLGRSGTGAWELAVRYSTLDLDDGGVRGGSIDNWTLGVNWYLNSATRLMLNYVRSELERRGGGADLFLIRAQVDF
jgi:phosphate-selective porin OprO/OprP